MFGIKKRPRGGHGLAGYDYGTPAAREETVTDLFSRARNARAVRENQWVRCNDYYNFLHDVTDEVRHAVREAGLGWDPAVVPDPFIMVESQIDPVVPTPEFRGRDDDLDSKKARQREYAVRYVCQNNRLEDLNTANERRLKKLGDAFWKVYWDDGMDCGPYRGDIRVRDVPVEALYPDPTAGADGLQAGQFVDYVYAMHKVDFLQRYGRELEQRGLTLEEILGGAYLDGDALFQQETSPAETDDTVQVIEHWFRHPIDQEGASAGDIGCTIQAGGHEVRYIPRYWQRTGAQNRRFPFVHYWCVRDENQFYNKSELFAILPLVDAADRELCNALLNDAFTANDIILMEENALADGEELTNVPGAVVKVRQNAMGRVARLGGLHDGRGSLPMLEWLLGQVQRTNRNFDTNQGKASSRIKTAAELGMLRSDVDSQMAIKKADRLMGFVRLYELIDWTVLEFYDSGRIIFLGGAEEGEAPVVFPFDPDALAQTRPGTEERYFPRVDVTVSAGEGVPRSPGATLQTLEKLAATNVTADNYQVLSAMLEVMDLPQKQEILAAWRKKFAQDGPGAAGGKGGEVLDLSQMRAGAAGAGAQGRRPGNPGLPQPPM